MAQRKIKGYKRSDGTKVKSHTKAIHTKRGRRRLSKKGTMSERFSVAGHKLRRDLSALMSGPKRRRRK